MNNSQTELLKAIHARIRTTVDMDDTVFGFIVDGEPYHILVSEGIVFLFAKAHPSPHVVITMSSEVLNALMDGSVGATQAYLSRSIAVDGPLRVARRVEALFAQ